MGAGRQDSGVRGGSPSSGSSASSSRRRLHPGQGKSLFQGLDRRDDVPTWLVSDEDARGSIPITAGFSHPLGGLAGPQEFGRCCVVAAANGIPPARRIYAPPPPQLPNGAACRSRSGEHRRRQRPCCLCRAGRLLRGRLGTSDDLSARLCAAPGRTAAATPIASPYRSSAREERRHPSLRLQPYSLRPPVRLLDRLDGLSLEVDRRKPCLEKGLGGAALRDFRRLDPVACAPRQHPQPRIPRSRNRFLPEHNPQSCRRGRMGGGVRPPVDSRTLKADSLSNWSLATPKARRLKVLRGVLNEGAG